MKAASLFLLLTAAPPTGPGAARAAAPFPPDMDPVYGASRSEVYRTRRVKEVFMDDETYGDGRVATARHLNQYQLLDRRGRPVREETAHNRVITYRHDSEYSAAGRPESSTAYARLGERPDTGRVGLAWLPARHTRYRTEGTEAAGDTGWDNETGRWQPLNRVRTATRHDTTYAETFTAAGALTQLERSFPAGPGPRTYRTDCLPFSERGLGEPKYYYHRLEHGQLVESGTVDFSQSLEAYLVQHPDALRYVFGSKRTAYLLTDFVARHSAGALVPTHTAAFNRRGQLLTETSYGERTTYLRDASGRTQSSRRGRPPAASTTAYYYRPDGLLAREAVTRSDGTPDENRFYRYSFYSPGPPNQGPATNAKKGRR